MKSKAIQLRMQCLCKTLFRNACTILLGLALILGSSCTPATQNKSTPAAQLKKPDITPTAAPATPTILPTATAHALPKAEPLICSPLAIQPLDKLNLIVTQPFIMPRVMDDGTYKDSGHHGLDVGFITRGKQKFTGTPVLAVVDGIISTIIHNRPPYGDMVMLETPYEHIPTKIIANHKIPVGDSLYTVYAHLQNIQQLIIGQEVNCGHQIAETGLTGMTDGPHLHFETRWGPARASFPVMAYYLSNVTADEVKNYTIWRMSGKYQLFDPFELLNP